MEPPGSRTAANASTLSTGLSLAHPFDVEEMPETPAIRRIGMGYRGLWPRQGVHISLNGLRVDRGDPSGILSIRCDGRELVGAARMNLTSMESRRRLAKDLEGGDQGVSGWRAILEDFCRTVVRLEIEPDASRQLTGERIRPANEWLVEPLLPFGVPSILFGPGGAMKSTLATALALAVATGYPLLEWSPRNGPVLVLDWESDEADWNDRAGQVARGFEIEFPKTIRHRRCDRTLASMTEIIAAETSALGVMLLIVDSVGLAAGVGHEGGDAAETAMRLFKSLRHIGCTSLLIDHVTGDSQDKPGSRPYGSVYKTNLARSTYEVRRERHPGRDGTQVMLRHAKVNRGRQRETMGIRVIHEEERIRFQRCELTAPDLAATGEGIEGRLAQLLGDEGAMPLQWLAKALDVAYDSVRMVVKRHPERFIRLEGPGGRIGLRA